MDEQDQIVNTMRPYIQERGLQPTRANLMVAYTGRVCSNIHMVLCMRYMCHPSLTGMAGWARVHLGLPAGHLVEVAVLCPGCHTTRLWNGPRSWVPRGVSQCLRA